MSQPDLINSGLYEEKPRSSIYTALLSISFLSLCIAALLLSMEMKVYDNDFKAEKAKGVVPLTVAPIEVEPVVEPEAPVEGEAPADGTTPAATPATSTDPDAGTPAATPAAPATPATPAAPAGT